MRVRSFSDRNLETVVAQALRIHSGVNARLPHEIDETVTPGCLRECVREHTLRCGAR